MGKTKELSAELRELLTSSSWKIVTTLFQTGQLSLDVDLGICTVCNKEVSIVWHNKEFPGAWKKTQIVTENYTKTVTRLI